MKLCIAVVHLIIQGKKQVNDGTVLAAGFSEIRQEEIMCPILESSGHNDPFNDDSDSSVYNNIQSQQDEQLRLITLQGLKEHNKICGFRGGNGLYRRYHCRDCLLVLTEDADNPDIGCERRKV